MPIQTQTLGNWLDLQKMTYREAAQRTGVSFQEIAHLATGKRRASRETARRLIVGLKLPRAEIIALAKEWGGWHFEEWTAWQELAQDDLSED